MRQVTTGLLLVAALALSGCAQAGFLAAGNLTSVELAEPNYAIVATGVAGQSSAAYLVGVGFSRGPVTQSVSLFRVSGTGELYGEAMDDLWRRFEAEHGPVVGRRLALVNLRYDANARNFLVYNDIALSIRADVVEFGEGDTRPGRRPRGGG